MLTGARDMLTGAGQAITCSAAIAVNFSVAGAF
jgi:hypothetical protein